jgi:hypothetical protein
MNFYPNIIYWPRVLNRDRLWKWKLAARSTTGGRAVSGLAPTVRTDGGGMWMAEMGDVQVSGPDHVRAWRALEGRLDSGVTPIVLEARDERHAPWPLVGGVPLVDQYESENSDGSTCSDGTGYVSDVISAEVKTAAALRATVLTLIVENAQALRGGEYLSIQHDTFSHRLYEVVKVRKVDTHDHAVKQFTVTIASPGVFTCTGHGLAARQQVYFRTSGALPTGLSPDTLYYVISTDLTADTFKVSTTEEGSAVNTSGSQSGAHRLITGGFPTVTVRPPLREATAVGTRVEFDYPKCVVKLADPDAMDLPLERRLYGSASPVFVEDFPPFELVEGDSEE